LSKRPANAPEQLEVAKDTLDQDSLGAELGRDLALKLNAALGVDMRSQPATMAMIPRLSQPRSAIRLRRVDLVTEPLHESFHDLKCLI
jgi:hypothetical protein